MNNSGIKYNKRVISYHNNLFVIYNKDIDKINKNNC
jgi:hypothetical protein